MAYRTAYSSRLCGPQPRMICAFMDSFTVDAKVIGLAYGYYNCIQNGGYVLASFVTGQLRATTHKHHGYFAVTIHYSLLLLAHNLARHLGRPLPDLVVGVVYGGLFGGPDAA